MTSETAYLAGGCFWGMEDLIRKIPGVTQVDVGYMGGEIPNATYDVVKKGQSQHAETVHILFNSEVLSFENLLLHFFRMHDPTTENQQGNDRGSQYRSAIFFTTEEQEKTAHQVIDRVNRSGLWKKPAVTQVVPAKAFWLAEEEHQDYLMKHPGGYTCHYVRDFKF